MWSWCKVDKADINYGPKFSLVLMWPWTISCGQGGHYWAWWGKYKSKSYPTWEQGTSKQEPGTETTSQHTAATSVVITDLNNHDQNNSSSHNILSDSDPL